MKKILFMLLAFVGFVSSCENDDIEVGKVVTFKLNSETVVSNLYERNAGDLTSISSNGVLNVCLYIYNSSGDLVDEDTQSFNSYTHIMTSLITLPDGDYTAVAFTFVTSSVDYWKFEGKEHLNTFKIVDGGYIGGKSKILGLTVHKFIVDDEDATINVDIKNAGAVACVRIANWNHYSDVTQYGLMGKQRCDYISFGGDGNVDFSLETKNEYNYYKILWDRDPDYNAGFGYFFTFPIKNASMKFFAKDKNDNIYYLGPNLVDAINLGDSYLITYDVENNETEWFDMTPSKKDAPARTVCKFVPDTDKYIEYNYQEKSISFK